MNKLLKNLKMMYKIIFLVLIMVLFLISLGISIFYILNNQEKNILTIFNNRIKKVEISTAIHENILNVHTHLFEIICWQNANYQSSQIKELGDEQRVAIGNTIKQIDDMIKSGDLTKEENTLFNESLNNMSEYKDWAFKVLDMAQIDLATATMFMSTANDKFTLLKNTLSKLEDLEDKLSTSNYNSTVRNKMFVFIAVMCIFIVCLILISVYTGRAIVAPIKEVIAIIKVISKGDFTKKLHIHSKDEMGELAEDFEWLKSNLNDDLLNVEKISRKLKQLSDNSGSILEKSSISIDSIQSSTKSIDIQTGNSTSGIEELTATLEEMSRNIDSIMNNMVRQASAVEEGASPIEEMVRNIENTTTMSKKTYEISNNLNNVANEGGNAVKNSIQSIKDVAEYSQQILKLLGLITNIAKQTNLLAMNAAIEAAHAGEAGKGFAIVADEIRRLSEDTNKNAKDIGDVVSTIVSRIEDSVKLAEKAGVGLDMITMYSQQNVQIINQLNVAMAEQNNGAKEILKATQDLVKITEEVKVSMTEQKGATDDFGDALKNLRDLSLENKNNIKKFIEDLRQLINYVNEMKKIIDENQNQANSLHNLVAKFVLENKGEEKTGLKLVE